MGNCRDVAMQRLYVVHFNKVIEKNALLHTKKLQQQKIKYTVMEDKTTLTEALFESTEEYVKTSYELLKLKTLDKTADVAATFVSHGIVILFLLLFIVGVNMGISLWLGELLGKSYYGFFCVAGFYGILGGILHFFMHNSLKKRVSNAIVSQIFN